MTQEQHTDDTDVSDESSESSVLNGVRKELREAQRQLKAIPDRDSMRAELKAELALDSKVETLLTGFGHPKGILDVVKGKLGEKEASRETVAEALASIGYEVDVEGATSESEGVESDTNADLAKVTKLSAEVQSAAKGGTTVNVLDQINAANTQDEVNAIMAKAGLLEDYGH